MLHLFSDEYKHMKFWKPANRTLIAASSILIMLTLLALAVLGCGIPSYPYLYPPEAKDIYADLPVLTFIHDANNDPDVFWGYEIFYRFYPSNPNSTGTSQAETDMQSYFTSSLQISSIISKTSSAAYNYGFRRAIVKETPDSIPQISIDPLQIANSFQIELVEPTDRTAPIELNLSYDESTIYTLYRSTEDNDAIKSFYPRSSSYVEDDTDIVDEEIDITSDFFVAFFAVPYGFDMDAFQELYANGSYEGMEYIGSFELQ